MGSCPSPWALRVKMSSRSPRKAAAALRASASRPGAAPPASWACGPTGGRKRGRRRSGRAPREVGLHRLEGRAGGEFTQLRGIGQPCLNGLHILRPDGARVQLRQQALEGAGQGWRRPPARPRRGLPGAPRCTPSRRRRPGPGPWRSRRFWPGRRRFAPALRCRRAARPEPTERPAPLL